MSFPRARRGSLLWLIAIGLVAVVGRKAPAMSADDLAGRRWTLADGDDRVTWVNFWATNCEPCRTEMPAMQRLADAYGERLRVLGLDWGESRDSVMDFVERYAIDSPILLDPSLDNFYRWSAWSGLPRHHFVDDGGTVVCEVIGPLAPARMLEIVGGLLGPA